MDEATLIALKESIEKWERRAAGDHHEKTGTATCPLCDLFHPFCNRGCPVAIKTGASFCQGSPYHKYIINKTDLSAKEQLDFLIALLPQGEKEESKAAKFK